MDQQFAPVHRNLSKYEGFEKYCLLIQWIEIIELDIIEELANRLSRKENRPPPIRGRPSPWKWLQGRASTTSLTDKGLSDSQSIA